MTASPSWMRALAVRRPRHAARHRSVARPLVLEPLEDRLAPAVSALGMNLSLLEGVKSSAVVATFTDSAATSVKPFMSAEINWGDGTKSQGTIVHMKQVGSNAF